MNKKLNELKEMVKAMDGDFTAQLFGYEMEGQSIVEDLKWLINQAEKVEQYEKALEFYAFAVASINEDGTVAKKVLGYSY